MRRAFLLTTGFIVLICAAAASNTSSQNKPTTNDVKIRQRMSSGGGQGVETVLYIKGQRMRNEMAGNGMGFTTILQCDLKRTLTINERTKTYMVSSTDGTTPGVAGDGGPALPSTQPPTQTPKRGGVVNVTSTITDTGERKQMFGFTARRIKTSIEKKASPDACDKDQKVETDGWYIDFQYAFTCPGDTQKQQTAPVHTRPDCKDEVRSRTIGTAKLGFPLHVTTTVYQPDGRTTTMTQEVLELSRESLSASLFEVPEGYALAKDMQALYGMGAASSSMTNTRPENNATAKANTSTTDNTTTTASTAKKPGAIRIGLVVPKVQTYTGDAARTAEAVRNDFAKHLNAPNIEVVTLAARVPSAALDEARQSQCDYVLNVSMNLKKGGGGGMFGRAIGNVAGAAAGHIPGGGTAASGAARSAAITGVYTTTAVVSSIKAKDELSLEYKLDRVDNANTVVTNTAKAKAKSDGEDILTPQIETAAQAILNAVRR